MLVIRFTRRGRKNDPSFRLVVSEQSNPIKGKFLEELGFYNPKLKSKSFDKERILYWISKGAKCSATVNNLLISSEVIQGQKVHAWRPKKREGGPPTGEARPEGGEAAKAEAKEEKTAQPAADKREEVAEPVAEEKKEEKAEEKPGTDEPEKK